MGSGATGQAAPYLNATWDSLLTLHLAALAAHDAPKATSTLAARLPREGNVNLLRRAFAGGPVDPKTFPTLNELPNASGIVGGNMPVRTPGHLTPLPPARLGYHGQPTVGGRVTKGNGRLYAGMSADERAALRHARLLQATRELIGTEGYAGTTVERICSTANVSTRHFYLQYDSKESAFIDLYDGLTNQSFQHVLSSWQDTAERPIGERISAALVAYLEPMFADVHLARIAFVEVMGVSPRLEAKRLEYRESLIAFVDSEGSAAAARGEIADRDFRFASLALIGAANTVVYDWAIRADRPPAADIQAKLADLAVTLIAG